LLHAAPTQAYPACLHDALPISSCATPAASVPASASFSDRRNASSSRSSARSVTHSTVDRIPAASTLIPAKPSTRWSRSEKLALRSEEHTSELQSRVEIVSRTLL